jgi:hypothetical protein
VPWDFAVNKTEDATDCAGEVDRYKEGVSW